jgi:hypothetical protein
MLKDHRCTCTGADCKVCRHLGRQRAVAARKRGRTLQSAGASAVSRGGAPAQGPAGPVDH